MSRTVVDGLVEDYLRRLDAAAAGLSPDRRSDLLESIGEHIDAALAEGAAGDEAAVRSLLDRLGTPEEIVAAAGGAPQSGPWGGLEVTALVLLAAGPLLLPVLSLAGLVLVLASSRWRRWEKVVSTVPCLLPVGLLVAFYVTEGDLFGLGLGNAALLVSYVSGIVLSGSAALFLGLRLRARS